MKIVARRRIKGIAGLIGLDAVFFGWTNAAQSPAWVMIVGFLLLSLTLYYAVYSLISFTSLYGISVRRRPLALYITGVLSLLVALQSMGGLGERDLMVALPLAIGGYLYSSYARSPKRNS